MGTKSNSASVQAEELVRLWKESQKASRKKRRRKDPVMEGIRKIRDRVYRRIGELDDSVALIREDRER